MLHQELTQSNDHNNKVAISRQSHSESKPHSYVEVDTKPSSYGATVKLENVIESVVGIVLGLLFFAMVILLAICTASDKITKNGYNLIFPLLLSYQIITIMLCTYYICRFEWNVIKSICKCNKFWIESLCCCIFSSISFTILIIRNSLKSVNKDDIYHDNWNYVLSASILLECFISLPAICIQLRHEYKSQTHYPDKRESQSQLVSLSSLNAQSMQSHTVSVTSGKAIFKDAILKGSICACYLVHFVIRPGFPLAIQIDSSPFINTLNIMYRTSTKQLHRLMSVNEIFRVIFVGMTLVDVFFTVLIELIDKQIITTSYTVFSKLWKHPHNRFDAFAISFCAVCLPFEAFPFHMSLLKKIINYIWISVNAIAMFISFGYIVLFSGIYSKTRYKFQKFFNASPTSPIKAFVLEGICLLCLYAVYIVFLGVVSLNNSSCNAIQWDVLRQLVILVLLCLQFISLVRVKQIQKFGRTYLERFDKISTKLYRYYKCMCLLLMYNILYIFIFNINYFVFYEQYQSVFSKHNNINVMFAYAFSFSAPSSMLLFLSHLLNSYDQWVTLQQKDKIHKENYSQFRNEDSELSVHQNSNQLLNDYLKMPKEKQHKTTILTVDSMVAQM
eukprot:128211_1